MAVSRTKFLHSCVRVSLQPQAKDNKVPEGYFLDEKELEAIDDKQIIPYEEAQPICILGHTYKDNITGFSGVALSTTQFLHSVERTALQPTKLKADGSLAEAFVFDSPQLTDTKAKSKAPAPLQKNARPGGPGIIAPQHSVPSGRR
jgi:hypothetical protein